MSKSNLHTHPIERHGKTAGSSWDVAEWLQAALHKNCQWFTYVRLLVTPRGHRGVNSCFLKLKKIHKMRKEGRKKVKPWMGTVYCTFSRACNYARSLSTAMTLHPWCGLCAFDSEFGFWLGGILTYYALWRFPAQNLRQHKVPQTNKRPKKQQTSRPAWIYICWERTLKIKDGEVSEAWCGNPMPRLSLPKWHMVQQANPPSPRTPTLFDVASAPFTSLIADCGRLCLRSISVFISWSTQCGTKGKMITPHRIPISSHISHPIRQQLEQFASFLFLAKS